ncbi:hypothetical protein BOX15_Mlig006752g2 [Macrostomum lignano]|uniref:Uncharacterized protein n=1 Tax=Macrostomum lignano TaxID=282301 RepID=A0A267FX14_9PLAT|nr:hypothetical protein BOX15_Mlig006752g2 [Macrostomum lignano]
MQPISNLQEIIACASMKAARTSRFRQSKLVADSASSSRPMYANYMDRSMSKNSSSEPSETTVRAASTDLEHQALNNSSGDQSFSESRLSVSLILDDPFLQTEDVPCGVINSLDELPAPGNSVCELWGTSFASHGVSEGKIYFETVLLHAKEQPSQRSAFRVGWSLVPRSNFCAANHGLPGSSKFSFAYSSKGYAILAGSLSRLPGLECAVGDRVAITIEIKKTDCNEALAIFNVAVASSPSGRHLARQSCPFSIRYQLPANIIDMVWVPHVAVVNSKLQLCFNKISSTLVRPSDNLSLAFNTAVPIAQFKPPEQPEVLFNVGLPLSGKTRFTEAQKSVHKDSQLMVVSLDLFFERLIAPELDESLSNEETLNRLFDYLQIAGNDLIHTCLTHATKMRSNIIIDFCNLSYGTRRNRVELCGPGYETKAIIFCPGAKMTKRMIKSGLASRNQSQLSNAYNYLKAVMELPGLHNAEFDNVSLFGSGVTEEVVLARAAEIRSEAEAMGSFPGDCDEFLMELYCRFGLDVPDFAAEVDLTELGPQLNEAEFQPSMLQPLRNDRPDMLAQEAEPDLLLHGQMDYDEQFDFVPGSPLTVIRTPWPSRKVLSFLRSEICPTGWQTLFARSIS